MLPEQLQRVIGFFLEEAKEDLRTIERGLVHWQMNSENQDELNQMIRSVHSIKGGAAMLGLNPIYRVARFLEDCFKLLRECPIPLDNKLESLFLKVFNSLVSLINQVSQSLGLNEEKSQQIMEEIEPILTELNAHLSRLIPLRINLRVSADDYTYILCGYAQSLRRFRTAIVHQMNLLSGTITRQHYDQQTQQFSLEVQLPDRTPLPNIRLATQQAGGLIGFVQTQRNFSLFSDLDNPFSHAIKRPKTCIGCHYYYGRNDGGFVLNCAVHPQGPEGETCQDYEGE
jgi:HPt (histidine-containing phosphotransfer) domain-containing protein